jgi:putative ABC transport system ATP-binding protein
MIKAHGLCKDYASGSGPVPALRGVSLRIEPGEFVAIMGPSGSGKSTLMNLLGLLDTPTGGRLFFEGADVTKLDPDSRADIRNRRIGFVFQSYNLLPRLTAFENVELPMIYAGISRRERVQRVIEAMEAVALNHRVWNWPAQLSGGEQQRVAIARSMVTRPALVLADEPTGALDSTTGEMVMALFRDMNAQGTAVVLVTHDPGIARQASRVLRLADGQMAGEGLALASEHGIAGLSAEVASRFLGHLKGTKGK